MEKQVFTPENIRDMIGCRVLIRMPKSMGEYEIAAAAMLDSYISVRLLKTRSDIGKWYSLDMLNFRFVKFTGNDTNPNR